MRVVAKKINSNISYLTKGKRYDVVGVNGGQFQFIDDVGDLVYCRFKYCPHIKASWTIIGNKAVVA